MDTYFTEEAKVLTRRLDQLHRRLTHRPTFTDTDAHRQFVAANRSVLHERQKDYPDLDWRYEARQLPAPASEQ